MKFVVVISLLLTTGLTAPVEDDLKDNIESRQEEGSIPVAVLLVVPEQPAFREEGDEVMKLSPESALTLPISDERAAKNYYGDSYGSSADKPVQPSSGAEGNVVATFSAAVSPSAIPLLLSCAPKVVTGKLQAAQPYQSAPAAYRSVFSDLAEILAPNSSDNELNLGDVLGLGSPSSVISSEGSEERKRRSSWIETGAARYKVSEDYPGIRQGNHHLVSEDYPHPNMVKLTPSQI